MRWLVLSVLVLVGCASAPIRTGQDVTEVNTDAILRLFGRFLVAHGCPVGPNLALTNGHVVDVRPFDQTPMFPLSWSNKLGQEGVANPVYLWMHRDLALMETDSTLLKWYKVAAEPPQPRDKLRTIGYNFDEAKELYKTVIMDVRVEHTVAKHIVFNPGTDFGASGACLLNAAEEVVGVTVWRALPNKGMGEVTGVGVGVWGEVFRR